MEEHPLLNNVSEASTAVTTSVYIPKLRKYQSEIAVEHYIALVEIQ